MSLVDDLMVVLSSCQQGYKLMRRRMAGHNEPSLYDRFSETSSTALRVTLSRLKKKGLADNSDGVWKITKRGITYLSDKANFHRAYDRRHQRPKNMIIAFDIPEAHKRKRNWLRFELKNLGFEMLQKSLWLGPAPLPKEFLETLNDLHLLNFVRFFEAKESDIV